MAGRYGVSSGSATRHSSRRRSRVRRRSRFHGVRVTVLSCSLAVTAGVFALAGTATGPDVPASAGVLPPLSERDGDDASRGTDRVPGTKTAGPVMVKVVVEPPVEAPVDPNVKPVADAALPAGSGTGHRVVFDITQQQVWLVDADDAVVRTYFVSGSRYDQLPTGTFDVFSKSRDTVSWHGTETMEYMVRFFRGENSNIGFHDLPVSTATGAEVQTLSQLGLPLSDGCIRQDLEDAVALWEHTEVGTPVVVVRT
ncbi:Lipoprotein-anchoring transpeptidase ErfK/SrfK [Jiangella alkaliphila]|uniref:Lipoprotein-anchoring transpeptidase ErfK/SrfK n=1 Tax=Jiangella alkaliphila TaxID=419479 RepID=A0A1H2JF27_9ACTN|nr:Lipoprotein-anchoring transpeptidase ErfK/SrfK [Jiangella alkaliphila]